MEIKFSGGVTDGGNSSTPMPISSYYLLPNQPFNVGTMTNFRPRNEIMVGGIYDVNIESLARDREIEKKRIKAEILKYGYGHLMRRRELENEARDELISEGKLIVRQPEGVSIINAPLLSLQPGLGGLDELALVNRLSGGINASFLQANCLEGEIDKRIHLANHHDLTDGRMSSGNRQDKNISDSLPFQRQPGVTNEVPCKPFIDLRKVVPLPKTTTSDVLTGSKRKFETSMIDSDDMAAVVSSKKTQQRWRCDLCQVTATSEQGLKDHLKGKKHKAKKKTLQRTAATSTSVSNISIKSEPPVQALDKSSDLAVVLSGITSTNISNIVCGNEVAKNLEALSPKNQSNGGFGLEERLETEEFKKIDINLKVWCTMCEVGTTDEASMEVHRAGKKHVSLLMEKGGGVIAVKNMPDDVQYVDSSRNEPAIKEKEVSLSNVDGKKGEVEVNEVETSEK